MAAPGEGPAGRSPAEGVGGWAPLTHPINVSSQDCSIRRAIYAPSPHLIAVCITGKPAAGRKPN